MDILEGTDEFNRGHNLATGEIPITVSDDERHDMFAAAMTLAHDPFDDDTPIVASCDLENPESCESCQ